MDILSLSFIIYYNYLSLLFIIIIYCYYLLLSLLIIIIYYHCLRMAEKAPVCEHDGARSKQIAFDEKVQIMMHSHIIKCPQSLGGGVKL